jgi:hypothetical protein
MEQRIVVVSEAPPRLEELDARATMKFLREYAGYELRSANIEAIVPMYRCLKPEDLKTLIECTEDDLVEKNIHVVRERAEEVARNVPVEQPVIVQEPVARARGEGVPGEGAEQDEAIQAPGEDNADGGLARVVEELFDSDDDTNLPARVFVKNSNEHIEEMLILMFGPEDASEAITLLKTIKMSKDSPFSKLSVATNYRRDWKMMLKWC